MDTERILRNTPATLTVTFYGDETPVDADATVTVTVKKADGTTLSTGSANHVGTVGSGQYSYDLAAQANLNLLTIDWSGKFSDVDGTITTYAEIVGGFFFTIAELRASDSALADATKYPLAALIDARQEVEDEFEEYCNRAFVPRFAREVIEASPTLYVEHPEVSTVLTVDGVAPTESFRIDGYALERVDNAWLTGTYYTIEYEYGSARVPTLIKKAALRRAKGNLVAARSRIDERATLMQIPDFGTFHLDTPDDRGPTGIPAVDVVLNRHRLGGWGIA